MGKPLERDYRRWLQKFVKDDLEEAKRRIKAEEEVFKKIRENNKPSLPPRSTLTVTKED